MTGQVAPANGAMTRKLMAAAGSVTALYALPTVSDAAIVHVSSPTSLNPFLYGPHGANQVEWDVDGGTLNAGPEFTIFGGSDGFLAVYSNFSGFYGRGLVRTSAEFDKAAQNLHASFSVGPTLASGYVWGARGARPLVYYPGSGGFLSAYGFDLNRDGFLGFAFEGGAGSTGNFAGDLFYGYARVNFDYVNGEFTIYEWYYNDEPFAPIHIEAPEPPVHALALLGLGAAGLTALRRRRKSKDQAV